VAKDMQIRREKEESAELQVELSAALEATAAQDQQLRRTAGSARYCVPLNPTLFEPSFSELCGVP